MTAEVGKAAPDFTLKDQAGNDVTLSSFKGKSSVALHFYPFTFTAVCEGELCRIRDDYSDFEQAGVQVLAVSCDSRHSQRVWGPSNRDSPSPCCPISGPTVRWPKSTGSSTSSSVAQSVQPPSSTSREPSSTSSAPTRWARRVTPSVMPPRWRSSSRSFEILAGQCSRSSLRSASRVITTCVRR